MERKDTIDSRWFEFLQINWPDSVAARLAFVLQLRFKLDFERTLV